MTHGMSTHDASDEILMSRFRTGQDDAAFTALVHRYEIELFGFLRRRLGHRESAEEAFQETFLRVYRHAGQFDATRSFRPWLFAIAANQARDTRRRGARERTVALVRSDDEGRGTLVETLAAAAGPSAAERAEAGETRTLVQAALHRLTEPQRRVITLIFGEGYKYREAAAALGIPVGTVKSRLHAAVRRVGRILDPLRPAGGRPAAATLRSGNRTDVRAWCGT
jgi:RNA polymerase sigma-70 factor (ECF subfamily)